MQWQEAVSSGGKWSMASHVVGLLGWAGHGAPQELLWKTLCKPNSKQPLTVPHFIPSYPQSAPPSRDKVLSTCRGQVS